MKAYHRVDPLMDERKGHYRPEQLGAFLKVMLVAGRQKNRGRFRSLDALRAILPGAYVEYVDFLVNEGDLLVQPDGSVYVDGWDEWQEGDLTVRDRMARLRDRQRGVTSTVTSTVTQAYPTVSANARANASTEGGSGGTDDPHAEPEFELLSWLASYGCYIRPGNGYHQALVTAVEAHGAEAIRRQFDRLASAGIKRGDVKGLVFGAIDALNAASRPDLKALEAEERATDREKASIARLWAQRVRNYHTTGVWDAAWGPSPDADRDDAKAEAAFLRPINPDPVTAIARASKEAAS